MTEKLRIILVDDDPEIAWGVGRCLTRAGCSVMTCGDGAEAIELLKSRQFDVLISDIQMPRLNGLELIEWVAKYRPDVRIMAMTAFGCPSIQQLVLKRGAIMYLEKPFDPQVLIDLFRPDQWRNSFYGSVNHIDLFDYVQLVFVTNRKLVLRISSCNDEDGLIFINDGTACHAVCGDLVGEEAFYRCLSFQGGVFSTMPWCAPEQETIDQKGEFLLMEAARIKDEHPRDDDRELGDETGIKLEWDIIPESTIPNKDGKEWI